MLTLLNENLPDQVFPALATALTEPDGLLAIGGCLSSQRLINAYRHGIFPWFNPGEPILWWSPDPRLVIFPEQLHISKSLAKTIRKNDYKVTFNQRFSDVISACAQVRKDETGTWISQQMKQAYIQLHQMGYAHSVETWADDQLIGGLYGVAVGQVFFGESMFHRQSNASKIAFVKLNQLLHNWGFKLIDCQVHTNHLASLGAKTIARIDFEQLLNKFCQQSPTHRAWGIQ